MYWQKLFLSQRFQIEKHFQPSKAWLHFISEIVLLTEEALV